MQKHQGALLMPGTPRMKAEVAVRAIVRRVTMKVITATGVRCVLATIDPLTAAIKVKTAISLAKVISPVKVAINLVLATIAKVDISKEKADIVQDIIAKAAINQEKAIKTAKAVISKEKEAISLVLAIIVMEKEVISLVKVATISALALKATILMQSIA